MASWKLMPMTFVKKSIAYQLTRSLPQVSTSGLHLAVAPGSGGASAVAFGPSPVGVFDDKTGEGAELEVIGFALGEGEAALLQHGRQRDEAGGTDLFAGPSGVVFIGERCHGLFSSGVE